MNRRIATLLVVAALLAGIGAACTVLADSLRTSETARNLAHVDTDATLEVRSAVVRAVNKVLTYRFDDVESTRRAAEDLLRGPAREQYRQLFTQVSDRAPEQRLTVTTRVVDSAVLFLTPDRAEVLVFADQVSVRGGDEPTAEPTSAAAQLLVTATRHGDRWLLTNLSQA
ncbi:hypothetical protein [Saccharomonospora cyanea]|uniref:Mce-associated membrane protein n=1 Tax=Saccharomonospora cyanea NA-134 TaxID=882082 RepID=H5XNF9_9PSEU|nr:hypothetical protein [Saccharomonospora cyanea]EHR59987.1 hypothetical protein SaccyDRAFT_1076 [Saccharomonospora cyanea NA-134]